MGYELAERTEPSNEPRSSPKIKMSKILMIKNITVVCAGIFTLALSYTGTQYLQSTINKEEGVGVASQAITLAVSSIASLLIPEYLIKRFGSKIIFSISIILYLPYILANFYPHWEVFVPASIITGIGISLLWSSSGTYLNDISVMLAEYMYSDEDLEKEIPKLLPTFDAIIGELSDGENEADCGEKNNTSPDRFVYITGRKMTFSDINVANIRRQSALSLSLRRNSFTGDERISTRRSSAFPMRKTGSIHKDQKYTFPPRQSLDGTKTIGETCTFEQSLNIEEREFPDKAKSASYYEMRLENVSDHNLQDSNEEEIKNIESKNTPDLASVYKKIYTEAITSRIFGIFGMAFLSSVLWGNLISFLIIGGTDSSSDMVNVTCYCGTKYCEGSLVCVNETLGGLTDEKRYVYFSVCTVLIIISFISVFFLLDDLGKKDEETAFTFKRLLATYEFSKNTDALLLIFFTFNSGMSTGFFLGDFTQAYSDCAFGLYHVTLSSACFGLSCAVSSSMAGWLIKYSDRKRVLSVAFVLNFSTDMTLLTWAPQPHHIKMLYIVAAIYGLYIGIVWSQTRALYGILFKEDEEAAFSAYYVWYFLGYCLSFAISGHFCIFEKVCVLTVLSVLGFIGYVIVEKRHKRNYFLK